MSQPLFIHPDETFIQRVSSEAKNNAQTSILSAPNLLQGLRVLSNPELAVSGIYFNPSDTSYSALRFVELALLQRPATPLYIIHPDFNSESIEGSLFLQTHHIDGAFKGHESFEFFSRFIQLKPKDILSTLKRIASPRSAHFGYTAIPVVDFIHSKTFPFTVLIEGTSKQLSLFAERNSSIDPDYLIKAAGFTSWLYVNNDDIQKIRETLQMSQGGISRINTIPTLWKTAEILFTTKESLNEMRRSGISDVLVDHTLTMLGDMFQMVSFMSSNPENGSFSKFIEQAKNCDQTIASATLSMMMCKAMKFERNAVLEILGIASLLQDVALFNSPFGDISKANIKNLPSDQQAYFLQHPLLSADLVAQTASIPDVALQVIRQQHERKDRSGYPNRIGGSQLHPMSEVLSLINSYLDLGEPTTENYKILEREVFPHYSEIIVSTFKEIIKPILVH